MLWNPAQQSWPCVALQEPNGLHCAAASHPTLQCHVAAAAAQFSPAAFPWPACSTSAHAGPGPAVVGQRQCRQGPSVSQSACGIHSPQADMLGVQWVDGILAEQATGRLQHMQNAGKRRPPPEASLLAESSARGHWVPQNPGLLGIS